jgi:hypothetical protein
VEPVEGSLCVENNIYWYVFSVTKAYSRDFRHCIDARSFDSARL